jgi:hypothetical protein
MGSEGFVDMSTPLERQLAEALALRIIDEFIGDDMPTGSHEKSLDALREFERMRDLEKNPILY